MARSFQIYHNFSKPRQSLNGQKPAQRSRIEIGPEENKWLQLIKASLQHNSHKTKSAS